MSEYSGEDRRNSKPGRPGELSLVVSGQRMPMLTLAGVIGALIAFFVSAVVYFVKVDDRTLSNATNIARNTQLVVEQQKLMSATQQAQVRLTTIQTTILRELQEHEGRPWHDEAGLEIHTLKGKKQ